MEIIKKDQRVTHAGESGATAHEYSSKNTNINFALVEIHGRFPEEGVMYNTVCDELVHIMAGECVLIDASGEHKMVAGDTVIITPNEKYFWTGQATVATVCTPPWTFDQQVREPEAEL